MSEFEPRIVVFACNWCSYAGADTAGAGRLKHSPKIRVIRTMCSGRVSTDHVLRAFRLGADGVLVSGCHFGDCHYIFGNHRAVEQFEVTKRLLHLLGLEPERVRLEWVSAAEGPRWAALVDEFVGQISALGQSPWCNGARPAAAAAEAGVAGGDRAGGGIPEDTMDVLAGDVAPEADPDRDCAAEDARASEEVAD